MWSVESLALVSIAAAILIAVLYSIAWYASIPSQLPPGPLGLPLVGCLPYIQSTTSHLTLEKWKEKYGNIMSFYMGSTLVVVLANYETMREALIKQGEIFNGRNVIRAFRPEGLVEGLGITGAEGDLWREQRAFCLKTLKDFGVGRSILEPKIRAEVHFLVDAIAESKGQPIDLQMLFHYAVSNIIVQMVFGKRYDYDDPVYVRYLETLSFRLSNSGVNALSTINFFPRIVALQSSSSAKTVVEESRLILDFIRQFIREKEANLDLDAEATDYMSAFLKAQKNGEGNYFFEDQLVIAVQQLFIAGTETTSTGLRWVIWYMATYPEYQEKVYKEVVETVGTEQLPLWADHSRMPFTEATICEVMRLATLAPLSITHRTTEDTTLMGYRIPKDSYVIPCLYTVHTDPVHFHQPRLFRPERFIDDKGQFVRHPAVLPFSAGKRTCLGESLARMEMFTYVTSLLQRFRFRFPDDVPRSAECPTVVGVIISPAPFKIIAEHRM